MSESQLSHYYRAIYFTLDMHYNVVPATFETWARWMDRSGHQRWVGRVSLGDVAISTYFLGVNVSTTGGLDLFETIAVVGGEKSVLERYATHDAAQAGHLRHIADTRARIEA